MKLLLLFFLIRTYITWSSYHQRKSDHILPHLVVAIWKVSWEDYLAKIYYDHVNAGSFSGTEKFTDMWDKREKKSWANIRSENYCKDKKPTVYREVFLDVSRKNKVIILGIDDQNKEIKWSFCQTQLQKVDLHKDNEFKVEKIFKSEGRWQNDYYLF